MTPSAAAAERASSSFCARISESPGYCVELPSVTQTIRTASSRRSACVAIVPPIPRTSSSGCAARTRMRLIRAPPRPRAACSSRSPRAAARLRRTRRRALGPAARRSSPPAPSASSAHGGRTPDHDLRVVEPGEGPGVRARLRAHPVVQVRRPRLPVDDAVRAESASATSSPCRASCCDAGRRAREDQRHGSAQELHVRQRQSLVQRRRRLVGRDRDLDLADDRPGVGGRIGDLEERHAGLREAAENRPRDRRPPTVTGQERRMHAVHGPSRRREERIPDEL